MPKVTPTSSRKADHIRINLEEDVRSGLTNGLERYHFIHQALPEINLKDVDLTVLINNWQKSPETGADPCADFSHAEEGAFIKYSVYGSDLSILLANWQTTTGQQQAIGDCPTYHP